jgi:hypothetical protein
MGPMESTQQDLPRLTQHDIPRHITLPKNNLAEKDTRFVKEFLKYVASINGRETIRLSIHDSFDTRFKVNLKRPPRLTLNDIRQIEMMCARIIELKVDLQRGTLNMEVWKHGKEISGCKRVRENYESAHKMPSSCNLESVEENDRQQIEGVLLLLVGMTELQFDLHIIRNTRVYNLVVSKIEQFNMKAIDNITSCFRAFISSIEFDFPGKQLIIVMRKTDTPMERIVEVPRKKVKLLSK